MQTIQFDRIPYELRLLPRSTCDFLSMKEFTILSRTISLQGWVLDVGWPFFVHDGIENSVGL